MRKVILAILATILASAPAVHAESPAINPMSWIFVGTYTGKASKGIYRVPFNISTGELGKAELAAEVASPSFLAISPKLDRLFCVCEISDFMGKNAGGVASYSLDAKTGVLKAHNQQSSVGAGPCHLVCDKEGKNVLVANYGGGSVTVLPIQAYGSLKEASCFIQHKGTSIDKGRQEGPHAHSINLDAANKFAIVADLGLDKVFAYRFDGATGELTANDPAALDLPGGNGPRHFAFHLNGKFAYVNNEMTSSLTALTYDADRGVLKAVNTLSTLPAPHKGNSTAETVVHPNGKFVYTSNRGHNSIAAFSINQETGAIESTGHQGEGIKVPRNFNIDPTGRWMIVANQDGGNIIVLEIDPTNGKLKPTGQKSEVGSPVCVKFVWAQ